MGVPNFAHSAAHRLHLVTWQGASLNSTVNLFLANIAALYNSILLKEMLNREKLTFFLTGASFLILVIQDGVVELVSLMWCMIAVRLIEIFETLLEKIPGWDDKTSSMAISLWSILEGSCLVFWYLYIRGYLSNHSYISLHFPYVEFCNTQSLSLFWELMQYVLIFITRLLIWWNFS